MHKRSTPPPRSALRFPLIFRKTQCARTDSNGRLSASKASDYPKKASKKRSLGPSAVTPVCQFPLLPTFKSATVAPAGGGEGGDLPKPKKGPSVWERLRKPEL